jgi:tetratricopeptide (TPR) repeat protein
MTKGLSVAAVIGSLTIFMGATLALPSDHPASDAEALIQCGHWKRARAILDAAVQAHPQDPKILYQLAQVKMAYQDFAGALPLAQHAVELDGRNSNYHLKLGQIYGEMAARANFLSAGLLAVKFRKEVEIALNLDPQNLEALDSMMQFKFRAPGLMGGDKGQARSLADKILRLNPSEGYISKAKLAELEKNVAEVEDCYRKAVEADPKSYHALTLLAGFYTYAPHAKHDLAAQHAQQAIEVDPSRVEAYGIGARVFALEQQWSDLDLILTVAQVMVPDDLRPYYEASNALLETGKDFPRAESYAKKYLSQEPEGDEPGAADAHRLLGLVLEKENRAADARAEIQIALRLKPNFKAAKDDLVRISRTVTSDK